MIVQMYSTAKEQTEQCSVSCSFSLPEVEEHIAAEKIFSFVIPKKCSINQKMDFMKQHPCEPTVLHNVSWSLLNFIIERIREINPFCENG